MKTTKKLNSGIVKLTQDNISSGLVRDKINFLLKDQKTFSDRELLLMRRKIIPDKGIGENIYIFAYGSLLWNPTFEFREQKIAKIYGFHRSFCMKTLLGRGSKKNPGLMLALDKGGSCKGSIYKLYRKNEVKEIDLLFKREMITGAYKPKLLRAELETGKRVTCLAFTVDKKNKNYISNLSLEEVANYIHKAHGFLGSCNEYFNFTIESLNELKIKDLKMQKIHKLIKKTAEKNFS